MARAKITKRFVDTLAPGARVQLIYDTELSGFGIRLMPSGHGAYIIEYRPDGGGRSIAKKRMTIGGIGSLTPDEARKLAREKLADVHKGHDPLADRQTKRREIKVHQLIDQWDKANPPGRRSGKPLTPTVKAYTLGRLRHHVIPLIGSRRVSEITVAAINDMLARIARGETRKDGPSGKKRGRVRARGGQGAARKVASDLSIVMTYAVEHRIIATNPVSGARKPKAGKRHSFLNPDQVSALAAALSDMERNGFYRPGIDMLRLLMLTGARPSELEQLKWTEVDLGARCLRLGETKTGYSQRPLSTPAVELIERQPRKQGSPYVFPTTRGEGYFTASKELWNEARERAGLPHVVRYDARHMVATMALSAGHDLASVAAIMGHANPRTTLAIYAHVIDENAALAANNIGAKVASLMSAPADEDEGDPQSKSAEA